VPRLLSEIASGRVDAYAETVPLTPFQRRASLARLDVVTREEYEVQARLLLRLGERVAALERRIEALEREEPAG